MTNGSADGDALPEGGRLGQTELPVFFFHAGGLPLAAIADLLDSTGCLGHPRNVFDLDGSMWVSARERASADFSSYLASLTDEARADGKRFAAFVDWRDLLWLERRPAFEDLLRHPFRAVRLAFLDPAMQARRRLMLVRSKEMEAGPDFPTLSRELIAVEEDEAVGDEFAKRYGQKLPRLWVEDLARSGVPSLRSLLDRWSIALPEETKLSPIEPPMSAELEAVAAFRDEARRRHWVHALTPRSA